MITVIWVANKILQLNKENGKTRRNRMTLCMHVKHTRVKLISKDTTQFFAANGSEWNSVLVVRFFSLMFVTAVCVLFLIKLRWPRTKSIYDSELTWRGLVTVSASWKILQVCHPCKFSAFIISLVFYPTNILSSPSNSGLFSTLENSDSELKA